MGGGHILRCLGLAEALARRGSKVTFVCASIPDTLAARVTEAGHALHRIDPTSPAPDGEPGWERKPLAPEHQRVDAGRTLRAAGEAEFVVVDHYQLDAAWLDAVEGARKLVVDDLANRPQPCDVLVDQTLGRSVSDYRSLVPGSCRVLAGPRYALLRSEFPAARPRALQRRLRGGPCRRVLISMGTTDVDGVTARALTSVLAAGVTSDIDVLLGHDAPSLGVVRETASRAPQVTLHIDRTEMASLMTEVDAAVGASGSSSWERCCLGLPAVTLAVAANQRLVAESLASVGATVAVGRPEQIGVTLAALIDDDNARAQMTAAAAAVTDGAGADVVAGVLLGEAARFQGRVRVRPAQADDSEVLWLWRNDPTTRSMAKSTDPVPWADHERWFEQTLQRDTTDLFIGEAGADVVGMVRFDREGAGALVSINVSPEARGGGIGTALLQEACAVFESVSRADVLVAEIRAANAASTQVFDKAGFVVDGGTRDGFVRMVRRCSPIDQRRDGR